MPDLTNIFHATVQDLSQASGGFSSGVRSGAVSKPPTPKAPTDPWIREAHQISRTIADLRTFILITRPAYLNLSRGGSGNSLGANMRLPRRSDSIPNVNNSHNTLSKSFTSSKVLNDLLDTVSSLTSLSDKDRDSIDTQVKVMMRQIKGAIEELESLEQDRRKRANTTTNSSNAAVAGLNQLLSMAASGAGSVDHLAQHRQGVTLYLNERLASLATLHKDQYEARIAREMEKRESSLYKALPKPTVSNSYGLKRQQDPESTSGISFNAGLSHRRNTNARTTATATITSNGAGATDSDLNDRSTNISRTSSPQPSTGVSTAQYYHQGSHNHRNNNNGFGGFVDNDEQDFENSLTAEQRQMLQMENENIVQKLETELNQVRHLEASMLELSSLHSTIQEHLEVQTLQTNRLHEEALTAISHIDAGNEQLIKAGKRSNTTRKWILFFLILASFVLLFLDWYD
ncbi:hypothetical protein BCR41DRAFT_385997 [Lobosporangium transversale]|uniref:SNARE-complex protein Syntaxin-18 N-terminal domain-containing protein n=1 Tax=Lobosporangium transversale TaxID=64571 RepID=A0A1Y2GPY1_9FUNG|nr:hypothetical protein BCR41DRAFT_385997 [Lobosporangium transversale]ORZ18341.1 hypothetical protein BCR41DRAFT_385997 [Lobosporangium transversale]|eukprot:XP_021882136.1 hypothetical protein BCR41DRAFT_385997 [Lobosporangium transversale]